MPRVREIVEFLRAAGETEADAPPAADAEIDGVTTDDDAGPRQMSWLSPARWEREPERAAAFRGALLVCPAGVRAGRSDAGAVLVPCASPKLAFTRAVTRFFGHLVEVRWPGPGESAVARDAVIGDGVRLAPGVVIGGGVTIGAGAVVGPNTCLANCDVAAGVVIGANCSIGLPGFGYAREGNGSGRGAYERFPHVGRVVIEEGVEIGSNVCIDRAALGATRIRRGAKIDNLVHVAHNVVVGENAVVIANSMLGGSAQIDDDAWVAPSVSVMNQARVGRGAVLGMGAVVLKSVDEGAVMVGNPARRLERRGGE
jgi:UDP-3-O-[3-hydroxymyristoyl] glucosamine N-acyltransferase